LHRDKIATKIYLKRVNLQEVLRIIYMLLVVILQMCLFDQYLSTSVIWM